MLCEKYKTALIDAAVTGDEPSSDVRAHAESCASCAAELAQQRAIVAALDANLHRTMNAPVSAAMLHRLEARLAQQPQPNHPPRYAQIFAAALATLTTAAALILFAMPKLHTHRPNPQTVALSQAAPSRTAPSTTDYRSQMIPMPLKPAVQLETRRVKHHSQTVAASRPEILVPPDDRIAFEHFLADFDGREVLVALTKRVPLQELRVAPLDVPDIQTASLTLEPVRESDAISNR